MVAKIAPANIALLPERALIRVEGPEWRAFLHNLLTHDMESLEPGRLRFAALLTPQGRLLHDLFVLAAEDAAVLDVAAEGRDALLKRLALYRLRAKVELTSAPGAVHAAWDGNPGPGWAEDPRLPQLGWRSLFYHGPTTTTAEDYAAHRLLLGVPDPARDAGDSTYPLEAGFDLLNGIDFKKGCFIGQETTSRMKRRGAIKTRMLPLVFEGPPPPPGTEVLAGDLRAGEVLTGREGRVMALLRLDRIAGAALTADGRPVRADPPPWLELASANSSQDGALPPTRPPR